LADTLVADPHYLSDLRHRQTGTVSIADRLVAIFTKRLCGTIKLLLPSSEEPCFASQFPARLWGLSSGSRDATILRRMAPIRLGRLRQPRRGRPLRPRATALAAIAIVIALTACGEEEGSPDHAEVKAAAQDQLSPLRPKVTVIDVTCASTKVECYAFATWRRRGVDHEATYVLHKRKSGKWVIDAVRDES
jgi:hypothetical protein